MQTKPANLSRHLVLFDFDGTLTQVDSLPVFLWQAVPFWVLVSGTVKFMFQLPSLLFLEKNQRAERAKATLMDVFFGGKTRQEMARAGSEFFKKHLLKMLRPEMLDALRSYRDAGATVAIVSASFDVWLIPFCKAENIDLLCTELLYENDVFLGRFATPNCNREEKARRIRECYDLNVFDRVIAYGNSKGDAAMLQLADEAFYCLPNGQITKWEST